MGVTFGVTERRVAIVARDGIGAVLHFTPEHGATAMKPVTGGASHVGQSSRSNVFGLGGASRGTLDVLWPGGVRNRLYHVRAGSTVTMPEIPCSYETDASFFPYLACVIGSLRELQSAEVISRRERRRLFASALLAYLEAH